jgi:hypothetical protein
MKNIIRLTHAQSCDVDLMANVVRELGSKVECTKCSSGIPLEFEIMQDSVNKMSLRSEETDVKRYYVDEQGKLIDLAN